MKKFSFLIILAFFTAAAGNCGNGAPFSGGSSYNPPQECFAASPAATGAVVSDAALLSHNAGADCLGCHSTLQNGANKKWTIAGTIYDGNSVSAPGASVTAGGQTMVSDQCGNFYSDAGVNGAIIAGPTSTAKGTMNPGDYSNNTNAGSCNQSGCHNGASVGRIY